VIQLHGSEPPEAVAELARRGAWRLWKSIRARGPDDVREAAERFGPWVQGILVEGFREGVVGGGGARLDPAGFPHLRGLVPGPLLLVVAGGLSADTVAAAVDHFAPDVVDVSSGVEIEPGRKDPALIARFIQEARR
jgi:phosphoribosylanthranilate isomerase